MTTSNKILAGGAALVALLLWHNAHASSQKPSKSILGSLGSWLDWPSSTQPATAGGDNTAGTSIGITVDCDPQNPGACSGPSASSTCVDDGSGAYCVPGGS